MRLIWAKDEAGEIGKVKPFPGVEVDACVLELMTWGRGKK